MDRRPVSKSELVEAQAVAAGLPLIPVMLPYPCTNKVYEDRMRAAIAEAKASGVTHIAFGDLFLEDIRDFPENTGATAGSDRVSS